MASRLQLLMKWFATGTDFCEWLPNLKYSLPIIVTLFVIGVQARGELTFQELMSRGEQILQKSRENQRNLLEEFQVLEEEWHRNQWHMVNSENLRLRGKYLLGFLRSALNPERVSSPAIRIPPMDPSFRWGTHGWLEHPGGCG